MLNHYISQTQRTINICGAIKSCLYIIKLGQVLRHSMNFSARGNLDRELAAILSLPRGYFFSVYIPYRYSLRRAQNYCFHFACVGTKKVARRIFLSEYNMRRRASTPVYERCSPQRPKPPWNIYGAPWVFLFSARSRLCLGEKGTEGNSRVAAYRDANRDVEFSGCS